MENKSSKNVLLNIKITRHDAADMHGLGLAEIVFYKNIFLM